MPTPNRYRLKRKFGPFSSGETFDRHGDFFLQTGDDGDSDAWKIGAHVVENTPELFEEVRQQPPYPITYPNANLTLVNTERRFIGNENLYEYKMAEGRLYKFLCQKWNDQAAGIPSNLLAGYALELKVEPRGYNENHRGFPTPGQAATFDALIGALFSGTES